MPVFNTVLSTLVQESDRGAVLIGATVVDSYLAKAFEHTAAPDSSRRVLKGLLKYPGALSSLAAKTDIAFATGIIGENLHRSIHILRKIRNDVAHSPSTFNLAEHREQMWRMFDLGPGVRSFINETAAKLLIESLLENVGETEERREPEERVFKSPKEVLNHLSETPATMALLQEKALRMEVGIAVAMICALLVFHWEQVIAKQHLPAQPPKA